MSISMDVNSLAQQIKDVTVNAATAVKDAVVGEAAPADDKDRVFIGNLNFETTEDEIRNLFSQVGEIVSVTLPTRRNFRTKSAQPSGIAFVGYSSEAEAQKAVETLNGKSLGERDVTVAIARPLASKKPKATRTTSTEETAEKTTTSTESAAETATTNEKKKRTRKPRAAASSATQTTPALADGEETAASTAAPETNGSVPKTRATRPPREKGPPSDGIPSTTTLFVAGLDHKTTDAELKELFATYNPTSAHVALRPIPRFMIKKLAEKGEQRLSRGFGFVTFADQDAQTAALNGMDGQKSGDRELAVKVAVDSPEKTETSTPAAVEVAA